MAGMLPGVELARRRRTSHQNHYQSHHRHQLESSSASSSQSSFLHTSMDETALKARSRLEEKLRGFSAPSGRVSKQPSSKEEKAIHPAAYRRESHTTTTLKRGKQPVQLDRVSSQREVCSICLEDFVAHQQVMNLPCCHKYHSNCLRPWLAAHSHCPYCRNHVNSTD
ncbi:hypothetical protein ACHQM5_027450 [Ranunculus cassubicifolius]